MRRYVEEESNDRERWVISYADFITLLFAFFVVMYSISSVNEGKYKVLSKSLENVFSDSKTNFSKLTVGQENPTGRNFSDREIALPRPGDYEALEDYQYSIDGTQEEVSGGGNEEEVGGLDEIADALKIQFEQLVDSDLISIESNDLWIEIQIRSSILFPSGLSTPSPQAAVIIKQISDQLKLVENPIHVEGFTDNIPINNQFFPSNWELSAARAAAVVRLLSEGGVAPDRLAAVGYGQYQPIGDNDTAEGRQKNRRVVMVISRQINEALNRSQSSQDSEAAKRVSEQREASQNSRSSGKPNYGIKDAIQKTKDEERDVERKKNIQQSIRR